MPYTPMSDLGQQGLFDITRTLLQQPDLGALSDALTRLVRQSALADSAAIVLWHSATHRASYFSTRDNGKIFEYEDETFLPTARCGVFSRPEALHCNFDQFRRPPKLAESNLYHPFGHYSMLPLAVEGQILAAASLSAIPTSRSEAEYERLHTFTQIVAVVAEQIQSRVTNNVDYDLLSRERDNFRILVAITNAVLSRPTWMSWSAKYQKRSITILKSMPSALRYAATGKAS